MSEPVSKRGLRLHWFTALVTLISLAIVGALSYAAYVVNDHSEDRLLRLKVAETGALLQAALTPSIQTPLASAAEFAAAANPGEQASAFGRYITTYVGAKKPFDAASLWEFQPDGQARKLANVGSDLELVKDPTRARAFLEHMTTLTGIGVVGMLSGPVRRLGYGYALTGPHPQYVVYAESLLPSRTEVAPTQGTPFSDLRFSLYLGRTTKSSALIEANAQQPGARTASTVVPFGDEAITLVASTAAPLGSALSNALWWIVALAGVLLASIAGVVTERLLRRRTAAEVLAADVQHLLAEQRDISESLQLAMVPTTPAPVSGLETAVRYVPGATGLQIGGDWYDVIRLGSGRTFVSIGDVVGRGVQAGAVMASVRSAVRAFVSEGHGPASVLDRVSRLIAETNRGYFATMLCGVLDRERGELTLADAGHLPPLLCCGETCYLEVEVGPPVGALSDARPYRERVVELPPQGRLLLFTDGLIERRGESIDDGLDRLRAAAHAATGTVEQFLDTITGQLRGESAQDDTAMLAVGWPA